MPSERHFQESTIATKIEKVFLCTIDQTQPSKKLLSKRTRCFLKMELNTILFHGLARNLCYATTNGHRVHFRSFFSTTCLFSFLSCLSLSRLTHVSVSVIRLTEHGQKRLGSQVPNWVHDEDISTSSFPPSVWCNTVQTGLPKGQARPVVKKQAGHSIENYWVEQLKKSSNDHFLKT